MVLVNKNPLLILIAQPLSQEEHPTRSTYHTPPVISLKIHYYITKSLGFEFGFGRPYKGHRIAFIASTLVNVPFTRMNLSKTSKETGYAFRGMDSSKQWKL